jgi:DNA polymerase elongation subunit (family B)
MMNGKQRSPDDTSEKHTKSKTRTKRPKKQPIVFQALDWRDCHMMLEEADENDSDEDNAVDEETSKKMGHYVIRVFGRTLPSPEYPQGQSIYCEITEYTPFFYIKSQGDPDERELKKYAESIIAKCSRTYKPYLEEVKIVEKCLFGGFEDGKKHKLIQLKFSNFFAMKHFIYLLKNPNDPIRHGPRRAIVKFDQYESNLDPILRAIHIMDVNSTGWLSINPEDYEVLPSDVSTCPINIRCTWDCVNKYDNDSISQYRILSFDLECTSADGSFPQPQRPADKIIQIGNTFSFYGQKECYKKVIFTLDECAPIEDVTVISFREERDMLLAWRKLIEEDDPDIITGYNIKGFDFNYLYERAKLLGVSERFEYFHRVKDVKSEFIIKDLSSAALGENKLKYYQMDGRVLIDLLKVARRDYALDSYKLDNLASVFIKEKIKNIYNKDNIHECTDENVLKLFHKALPTYKNYLVDFIKTKNESKFGTKSDIVRLINDKLEKIKTKLNSHNNVKTTKYDAHDVYSDSDNSDNESLSTNHVTHHGHHKFAFTAEMTLNEILTNSKFKELYTKLEAANLSQDLAAMKYELDNLTRDYKKTERAADLLDENITVLAIKSADDFALKNYIKIKIDDNILESDYKSGKKFLILDIDKTNNLLKVMGHVDFTDINGDKSVCLVKDDMEPRDIFVLQNGFSEDRRIIAEYCLQDCTLCNRLIQKLQIVTNNMAMASVCHVPFQYIFFRGQGIKCYSLVAKNCRQLNYVIPTLEKAQDVAGYEGATVLVPKAGMYFSPVVVLDYASLYPSSMIERNLSHEMIVTNEKYNNLPNYRYHDITYNSNTWEFKFVDNRSLNLTYIDETKNAFKVYDHAGKEKTISKSLLREPPKPLTIKCRFAQKMETTPDGKTNYLLGIIPQILHNLLEERRWVRKKIKFKTYTMKDGTEFAGLSVFEDETNMTIMDKNKQKLTLVKADIVGKRDTYDMFMKAILDGMQLALKVTANSLYGQIGAQTSPIYLKNIAACTTATGRERLHFAMKFIKEFHPDCEVIYGDTDSIFVDFKLKDENGRIRTDAQARVDAMKLGEAASAAVKKVLPYPHDLEYDKTLHPFIILTKKRYVGHLYEEDPNDYHLKSMGIALKRRDYAPIVKVIYGGMINILLEEKDKVKALQFLDNSLKKLMNGEYPLDFFILSKSLKSTYKNPNSQPHVALATRMGERDPGSKPQVNDRVQFVYIETKKKVTHQGDRVEHVDYVKENNLKVDYLFYLTNQIEKPITQVLSVIIDKPKAIFEKYKMLEDNRRKGRTMITKEFLEDSDGDLSDDSENLSYDSGESDDEDDDFDDDDE